VCAKLAKLKKKVRVLQHAVKALWCSNGKIKGMCQLYSPSMMGLVPKIRGMDNMKPKCVRNCNVRMGGIDLKDKKLQPYLLERKLGMKWYLKFFMTILNVTVHNAYIFYSTQTKSSSNLQN
jgi:hypothetical protein